MDAITDITIKKVVIMSAAQVGKTDAMVLNPIGYYVHYDPSPIMVISADNRHGREVFKRKAVTYVA